jgi:hypothetical protein
LPDCVFIPPPESFPPCIFSSSKLWSSFLLGALKLRICHLMHTAIIATTGRWMQL